MVDPIQGFAGARRGLSALAILLLAAGCSTDWGPRCADGRRLNG